MRIRVVSLTVLAMLLSAGSASAQDRLPTYLRANTFVAGQLFGCAIRLEIYHARTRAGAEEKGQPFPPAYQLDLIAGLDVAALKADTVAALQAATAGSFNTDELEVMIAEMARVEYQGVEVAETGYQDAWVQAASCVGLFWQFGLNEIYR